MRLKMNNKLYEMDRYDIAIIILVGIAIGTLFGLSL